MAFAQIDGVLRTAYDDEGPRPDTPVLPLVLLHGHPFDRSMWAPQRERFARERRVLVPDLRGYGESTVVPGTTPFAVLAEDLRALLDHLGIGEFVLGGLSMGGQLAMECVGLFGARVRGLLLADTFAEPETPDGVLSRRALADRLSLEGMSGYAGEVLTRMVASPPGSPVAEHVLRMMRSAPPEGAAAALRGRALRPDYRPVLRAVRAPALVVTGRLDTYTPVAVAESLHVLLPHAALRIIEDAAHLPNLERPTEFNEALSSLLSRAETTRS